MRTGTSTMTYSPFRAILLFSLAVSTHAQTSAINDLIRDDARLVGPGVRLRLTPMGTAYVTGTVARMLVPEVALAKIPSEARTATCGRKWIRTRRRRPSHWRSGDSVQARFQMEVAVEVKRNTRGYPGLRDAVSRDGHTLFQNLICPRIVFLIEKRCFRLVVIIYVPLFTKSINDSACSLPRIALGDLSNFDLVKSILASQQQLRRRSIR
ncbi:hypothetical protein COOONC_17143 [Cooperia oncophora]